MSMAIGHFGLGAGATNLIFLLIRRQKVRVENEGSIGIAGGIWAMIPDVGKLIPALRLLHDGWWTDIFWLHRFQDHVIDPTDDPWISAGLFGFWLITHAVFILINKLQKE